MKSQPVEALEVVELDLRAAKEFYSWRSDGSDYFHGQFLEAVHWIEWNPEMFSKKFGFFRRVIIRNTFFAIFYAIEPDVTTIVAVVDMRQRPRGILKLVRGRKKL